MLRERVLASVALRGCAAAQRTRTRCPRFCPTRCLRRRTWSTPASPARRVSMCRGHTHALALARLLDEVLALLSRKEAMIDPRARVPAELLQPRLLARFAADGLAAQQRRPFVPAAGWAQHLRAWATRHLWSRTARPASRAAVPRRSTAPRAPSRHTPRAAAARGAPWPGCNRPRSMQSQSGCTSAVRTPANQHRTAQPQVVHSCSAGTEGRRFAQHVSTFEPPNDERSARAATV